MLCCVMFSKRNFFQQLNEATSIIITSEFSFSENCHPIKSLACYPDTFLLTLLLQLLLNSTFLLSAQSLNTGVYIIWDPSSPNLSQSLDSVQHFALKIAAKFRPSLIPSILSTFNLPSLTSRRQKAKLIFLFKLLHDYIYFPSQISHPTLPPSYPLRSFHASNLISPFI